MSKLISMRKYQNMLSLIFLFENKILFSSIWGNFRPRKWNCCILYNWGDIWIHIPEFSFEVLPKGLVSNHCVSNAVINFDESKWFLPMEKYKWYSFISQIRNPCKETITNEAIIMAKSQKCFRCHLFYI